MMQAQMAAPAPSAESADLASRSQLSLQALTHNAQAVEHVRGLMSIFSGAAAGVLGATGILQVGGKGGGWEGGGREGRKRAAPYIHAGGPCSRLSVSLPRAFHALFPLYMALSVFSPDPNPSTQSHKGALVFLVFYLLTSLGLLLKMNLTGDVSTYFPTKWYAFLLADAANHLLSFLLFWTMGYTLIHIY